MSEVDDIAHYTTMFQALMMLVAIATGAMCAELPRTEAAPAPAPVYRPEADAPQADAPAPAQYRPEPAHVKRESFGVDLVGDQGAYSAQDRKKHSPQGAEASGAYVGVMPVPVAAPAQEVTYPEVAYAPGYGYEPSYGSQHSYDRYGNAVGFYDQDLEPYVPPTALSLIWSALPDARSVAGALGRTLSWALSSAFVVALGAALTVGACAVTGLCDVSFRGLAVTEGMRSLVTEQRLQQLGAAAGLLQRALNKYGAMQRASSDRGSRRR